MSAEHTRRRACPSSALYGASSRNDGVWEKGQRELQKQKQKHNLRPASPSGYMADTATRRVQSPIHIKQSVMRLGAKAFRPVLPTRGIGDSDDQDEQTRDD